jgi:hypothetical protein
MSGTVPESLSAIEDNNGGSSLHKPVEGIIIDNHLFIINVNVQHYLNTILMPIIYFVLALSGLPLLQSKQCNANF